MTHREPNQPNRFLEVTEAVMLIILLALPALVLAYGAWMIYESMIEAFTQVFA